MKTFKKFRYPLSVYWEVVGVRETYLAFDRVIPKTYWFVPAS